MLNILYFTLLLYASIGLALFIFQRSFIYFPVSNTVQPQLAEWPIKINGLQLQGFMANSGQDTLVWYFGGNAEQIALSLPEIARVLPQASVVGFHYRGYGASEGEPSERGLIADALAIYDKLAGEYKRIVLVGRSLGSSVAVQLAAQRKVDRLILVTPFDSIANIAQDMYWYYPVRWILRDKFESVKFAPQINCPVLVLVAGEDTTVPNKYTQNLLQSLPADLRQSKTFPTAGHNDIQSHQGYYASLSEFVN